MAAQTSDSDAPPAPDKNAVVLDRFVVSTEKLNAEREDIVPSLGAAEFHIDRIQLDALSLGASNGINEALLRVPGVAQDSYGQVHIRGEHGDLQYRINDVLLPEGLSGFGQELDTRFAESVNVLTGALPAQYGYRTAGVVDIHSREAGSAGGEASLYGGSFGTARFSASGSVGTGALRGYATATAEQTDLGVENPTPERDALHDRKQAERVFAHFSYTFNDSSRLSAMVSASAAGFHIPDVPGEAPGFAVAGVAPRTSDSVDDRQREQNHYAIVAYQRTRGNFSGQAAAYFRYSTVEFTPDRTGDLMFNGVASAVRRALVGSGIELDGKYSATTAHTLRAGLLATSSNAGTRTRTDVFATAADGAQTSDVPFAIADDQRKLGWVAGVYAQDDWKVSCQGTLNVGARADTAHGYVTEGQLSPRANLVYQLSASTSAHVGYARYFTPPPIELIQTGTVAKFAGTTNAAPSNVSSPVRAERSDYFDTGISHHIGRDFSMTLDAYDKRGTNILDEGQFGTALIFSPFNYRVGHVYGVEFAANYAKNGWNAYANAAVSRAKAREIVSGEFQFDPDELAFIATHDVHLDHDQLYTASAGVSYRWGKNLAATDFLYGSGLRRGFANTAHLPEYHPVNISFEHTFALASAHELRARVDVVNVFDETYELRDGSGIGVGAPQFGARRGVYGGLTLTF
jgi:hypothetical protein